MAQKVTKVRIGPKSIKFVEHEISIGSGAARIHTSLSHLGSTAQDVTILPRKSSVPSSLSQMGAAGYDAIMIKGHLATPVR
jgi:hypothetical protein